MHFALRRRPPGRHETIRTGDATIHVGELARGAVVKAAAAAGIARRTARELAESGDLVGYWTVSSPDASGDVSENATLVRINRATSVAVMWPIGSAVTITSAQIALVHRLTRAHPALRHVSQWTSDAENMLAKTLLAAGFRLDTRPTTASDASARTDGRLYTLPVGSQTSDLRG